jgi:hypothetical protein|tara:strand:- start:436 stop:594 length:159 start_codon:yes stop_codon:yes gene_type:complete
MRDDMPIAVVYNQQHIRRKVITVTFHTDFSMVYFISSVLRIDRHTWKKKTDK